MGKLFVSIVEKLLKRTATHSAEAKDPVSLRSIYRTYNLFVHLEHLSTATMTNWHDCSAHYLVHQYYILADFSASCCQPEGKWTSS